MADLLTTLCEMQVFQIIEVDDYLCASVGNKLTTKCFMQKEVMFSSNAFIENKCKYTSII